MADEQNPNKSQQNPGRQTSKAGRADSKVRIQARSPHSRTQNSGQERLCQDQQGWSEPISVLKARLRPGY